MLVALKTCICSACERLQRVNSLTYGRQRSRSCFPCCSIGLACNTDRHVPCGMIGTLLCRNHQQRYPEYQEWPFLQPEPVYYTYRNFGIRYWDNCYIVEYRQDVLSTVMRYRLFHLFRCHDRIRGIPHRNRLLCCLQDLWGCSCRDRLLLSTHYEPGRLVIGPSSLPLHRLWHPSGSGNSNQFYRRRCQSQAPARFRQ